MQNETGRCYKAFDPPLPSSPPPCLSFPPLPRESPVTATSVEEKATSKRKLELSEELGNEGKRKRSSEEDVFAAPNEDNKRTEETREQVDKEKGTLDQEKERRVIIMKGSLPNLSLPDGWIALNHRSGGIIYLHRPSRVCSWSRPYFIGGGSVRKHDVPIAAIPCFHQRRALSQEKGRLEEDDETASAQISKRGASVLNALNMIQRNRETTETPNKTVETEVEIQKNGEIAETPNKRVETEVEKVSVVAGRDMSGLEMLISLYGTDDVTEEDGLTERDGVTEREYMTERDCMTEIDGVTKRGSVTKPSNSTQDSIAAVGFDKTQTESRKESTTPKQSLKIQKESTFESNAHKTTAPISVVDSDELGAYLSNLWEFQLLSSEQEQNAIKVVEPPVLRELELPSSLECLPYSVKGVDSGKQPNKEWILHTSGKTPVAILHEYCQRVLKAKPTYLFSECDNPDSPFFAEVEIDGIKYGSGTASNKKIARQIAAETALEVLMPGNFKKIRDCQISEGELEFFDKVDILDPRIFDFCSKTSLPIPSQILEECLSRNQGVCSSPIQFTTVCGEDKTLSFEITCGRHTAKGPCKNKRIGKQLASQAILKKLHPHLELWGALIRIYCDRPTGSIKKYKKDDSETFGEEQGAGSNAPPNKDMLERLKDEMRKLHSEVKDTRRINEKNNSTEPVFTVDF